MLRFLFPLISLAIASLSIAVELYPRTADSRVCLSGGCRFDQIIASASTPATVAALLNENPGDPGVWCTYGEFWASRGESAKAKAAFDRALELGPGLSPVLMRIANFDFTHDRQNRALRLVPQILLQTDEFDQLLFSYLRTSGIPASRMLGSVIPATPRVANSRLGWARSQGTDQELLETWAWMREQKLIDEKSAMETATALWQRKSYYQAQSLWAGWLGTRSGDYLNPQLLANTDFREARSGTPFEWTLRPNAGVEFIRREGLEIHFLGTENVDRPGVEQATAIEPGRYRFSAEVSADQITTDEGPFFQVTDAENSARLSVETRPITEKVSRSWISLDFTVPASTAAAKVQLVRRPSLKFDNKIAGTLHIYRTSLVSIPRT